MIQKPKAKRKITADLFLMASLQIAALSGYARMIRPTPAESSLNSSFHHKRYPAAVCGARRRLYATLALWTVGPRGVTSPGFSATEAVPLQNPSPVISTGYSVAVHRRNAVLGCSVPGVVPSLSLGPPDGRIVWSTRPRLGESDSSTNVFRERL